MLAPGIINEVAAAEAVAYTCTFDSNASVIERYCQANPEHETTTQEQLVGASIDVALSNALVDEDNRGLAAKLARAGKREASMEWAMRV